MKYILVIDSGTTYMKAFLFDENLLLKRSARRELRTYAPQDSFVEQDADEYFEKGKESCLEAVSAEGIDWRDIVCLALTTQRSTVIVWDKATGIPARPAITWQDGRMSGIYERVFSDKNCQFAGRTGRRGPMAPGLAIAWFHENEQDTWDKLVRGEALLGTPDAYLTYRFTRGERFHTSFSNAGAYGLYDNIDEKWSIPLLKHMNAYDPNLSFPEVLDDIADYGTTAEGIFPVRLPISAVIADQQAEMLANKVCGSVGKCTVSTGIFVGINAGGTFRAAPKGLKNQNAWRINGKAEYLFEGQGGMAGSVLQWAREELGLFHEYSELEELAGSVPDSGGVVFIPAFTGMMAPFWDASAHGTIFGLSRSTTKAHMIRALFEGIAYRVKDILVSAEAQTDTPIRLLRAGGGVTKSGTFCRILADITGIPVERTGIEDPSALGCALLAAYGTGILNQDQFENRRLDDVVRYEPAIDEKAREKGYERWKTAVSRMLNWPT
jgi:glycerol kinase